METVKKIHISWRTIIEAAIALIMLINIFQMRKEMNNLTSKIHDSKIELKIIKE